MTLPAIDGALNASTRLQQQLALLQTVESIRHHLATQGNSLPASLDELELPVPLDPVSGQPFEYHLHQPAATQHQRATLLGAKLPNLRFQLDLQVAVSD